MKCSVLLFSFLQLITWTSFACSPTELYPADPFRGSWLKDTACEDLKPSAEKVVDFDAADSKSGVGAKYVLRSTGTDEYTIFFKLNYDNSNPLITDKIKMCMNRMNGNVDGKHVRFALLSSTSDKYDEVASPIKVAMNEPCNMLLQQLMQLAGLQIESSKNPLLQIACARPEGPENSLMNENVKDENGNLQERVLYPAHLRALIYPM